MAEILEFPGRAETRSKADRAFAPIIAQEDINAQEADEKRAALLQKIGHALIWGLIWTAVLAIIGFTGVV